MNKDDPSDDWKVVSLPMRQFGALIEPILEKKSVFEAELRGLLSKHGFKETFIEHAVTDLVEAFMNDDEIPLWHQPWFKPPSEV